MSEDVGLNVGMSENVGDIAKMSEDVGPTFTITTVQLYCIFVNFGECRKKNSDNHEYYFRQSRLVLFEYTDFIVSVPVEVFFTMW